MNERVYVVYRISLHTDFTIGNPRVDLSLKQNIDF